MARFFFDISAVAWHLKRAPHFSGIQRAVTLIVDRVARQIDTSDAYLAYFDKATGQYRAMPLAAFAPGDITDADMLRAALGYGRPTKTTIPALQRYAGRPAKYWFHRSVLELSALLGREQPFRRNNTTLAEWRAQRQTTGVWRARVPTTAFEDLARPGDRLVLLDGTFTVSRAEQAFRKARAAGLSVDMMIHDLIPVVLPQVCSDLGALNFHDWLRRTGDYVSGYLANSEATRADLAAFLATYGIDRAIKVVPFAQEALQGRATNAPRGPLIEAIDPIAYPALQGAAGITERVRSLAAYPYVLCVGTMELRKNIWRTAVAWDRMRQMPGVALPKLVFAGRPGSLRQDFDDLLAGTRNLNGWIRVVEGPTDQELDFLYRNCSFTIMPSVYEGWGLPVGESLGYGKTAVISRTTSLPEVGGDLVEYCDPQSIDSIAEACLRLIGDPTRREALEQRIATARLRSWDDVSRDLLAAISSRG